MNLAQLAPRTCESIGCALCCKVLLIEELGKPAHKWCKHAKPENSRDPGACTCYDTRPNACRGFQCTWLRESGWPRHLDPVSTQCVIVPRISTAPDGSNVETICVHENKPGASLALDGALAGIFITCPDIVILIYGSRTASTVIYDKHGKRHVLWTTEASKTGETDMPMVTHRMMARYDHSPAMVREVLSQTWQSAMHERQVDGAAKTS